MTPRQKEIAQRKAAAALKREKSRKLKERKAAAVARRKVRMAVRMAPKHRLKRWSERVRERDGACVVCGRTDRLQAHHLLPKERYKEFKYRKINAVSLCPTHHKWGRFSAHRHPIWFAVWLEENRPQQYQWCLENMGDRVEYETDTGQTGQTR